MNNFNFKEWLDESIKNGISRHERICFLLMANGSIEVNSWGFISYHNGHQIGLEQNEAIELIYLHGFITALEDCGVDLSPLKNYLDDYKQKHGFNEVVKNEGTEID